MVAQLQPLIGTQPACQALAVPRASYYRFQNPAPKPEPKNTALVRTHPRALTLAERTEVIATLNSEPLRDLAIPQAYVTLLDDGVYLCSQRSMYRYLQELDQVRERRSQLSHPHRQKPQLTATAPNQVWSWDITKLQGPAKWSCFYLYVVLDIFSRYVVGWMLATAQSAALAQRLLQAAYLKQAVAPGQLIVHSDRGAPMVAKPLALLLADLGVLRSFSRPRVSNDNPFSESQFKTLKYRPDFPDRFGSLEHGRQFLRSFFDWYNTQHYHSGIAWLTPASVHFSHAQTVLQKRQAVLQAAYTRHTDRFVGGPPLVKPLPAAVWINPPVAEDLLGSPSLPVFGKRTTIPSKRRSPSPKRAQKTICFLKPNRLS